MTEPAAGRAPSGVPGDPGPGLPEPAPVPVAIRLLEVARRVPTGAIGEVWIFPPLPEIEESAEFLVFTRYEEDGRLRLYTARRRRGSPVATADRPEGEAAGATTGADPQEEVRAHGVVPADRLPRLLERFQRRVGPDHEPVHVRVEGSDDRWRALVRRAEPGEPEQGSAPVEPDAGPGGTDIDERGAIP